MNMRRITIDSDLLDQVKSLVTEDEAEVEHMAVAMTLLLRLDHARRETAMKAALVVAAEIASRYPTVLESNTVRSYFMYTMEAVTEAMAEKAMLDATPVGDA
jgi:hypothetical protein